MNRYSLSQEFLKEALDYNPDTGIFTWKERPGHHFPTKHGVAVSNGRFSGKVAGCEAGNGYINIRIDNWLVGAHRLAYLYMTGRFPEDEIDHINHLRNDNRWANLRGASKKENRKNALMMSTNTSGFNGVHFDKAKNKWAARINANKKYIFIGNFENKIDAIEARKAANIKYDYHPNHGVGQAGINGN